MDVLSTLEKFSSALGAQCRVRSTHLETESSYSWGKPKTSVYMVF